MAALLSASQWQLYKDAINAAGETFNEVPITWRRKTVHMDRYGEDPTGAGAAFVDVEIKALVLSNYFRSWPINDAKLVGELDEENLTIMLNYEYIRDNNWVTTDGYFDFEPVLDLFLIKGRAYKAFGDIDVAYANDEPMMFWINVAREIISTGQKTNP